MILVNPTRWCPSSLPKLTQTPEDTHTYIYIYASVNDGLWVIDAYIQDIVHIHKYVHLIAYVILCIFGYVYIYIYICISVYAYKHTHILFIYGLFV